MCCMKPTMTRRSFVQAASCGAAWTACASASREGAAEDAATRPNILLIHADQHRADCLGSYGNSDIRTPRLDALASEGTRFDRAYCPYPVCTPSRYSLLCGLAAHEHRGTSNYCTLAPDIETFPKILRRAGYRTAAVGKMHFTPTYLDVGFERMVLAEQDGPGRWDDDYHRALRDAGLVDVNDLEDQRKEYRDHAGPEYWESFGALVSNLPARYHSTEWIVERAIEAIEGWTPSGNLLMAGFIKPHHPFDPPESWRDAYNPDKLSILPGWTPQCAPHDLALNKGYFPHESLAEKALRRAMAYYYACIEHIDQQVGRMIDLLKRKGLYDDTLIVYTSDHGEYLGSHHLLLKGGYMYEPLVRVPLIVKYPKGRAAGPVSSAQTSNTDLAPTILRQAGCAPAPIMRGIDLATNTEGHEFVFAESGRGRQRMARSRRCKLIVSRQPSLAMLFDLEKDPIESQNRYGDPAYAEEQRRLEEALRQWGGEEAQEPYLDENAPVIAQPNVPKRDDDHRIAIERYYRDKMKAIKGNPA